MNSSTKICTWPHRISQDRRFGTWFNEKFDSMWHTICSRQPEFLIILCWCTYVHVCKESISVSSFFKLAFTWQMKVIRSLNKYGCNRVMYYLFQAGKCYRLRDIVHNQPSMMHVLSRGQFKEELYIAHQDYIRSRHMRNNHRSQWIVAEHRVGRLLYRYSAQDLGMGLLQPSCSLQILLLLLPLLLSLSIL